MSRGDEGSAVPPRQQRKRDPSRLLTNVPVPWLFVLTYLAGVGLELVHPLADRAAASPAIPLIGAGLFVLGALLAGWGWSLFYRTGTTRVPGQSSTTLVTWGPYRLTRNPMYVGLAIAYLGEAGLLVQVWPVVLLPLTIAYLNAVVIPVEEARLREVFGAAFDRYRSSVRRWI